MPKTFTLLDSKQTADSKIRYVALGDSYSNGEGLSPDQAWPVLLTKHLKDAGHNIELVANPSISGWTTQNLIEGELEEFKLSKPTFATLLIGANDAFQGVPDKVFQKNYVKILDEMQKNLSDKKAIILVTIPDFSVTKLVKAYPNSKDLQKKIEKFNNLIKEEGRKRDLKVVDVFQITKAMGEDSSLVASDDLHPSAKELKLWEGKIFPVARALLK